MKKILSLDNKGFVLVETIIVAVFVIGICTFLFANFMPLIADYERISYYDTLEAKYKAHEIRKMLLREIAMDPSKEDVLKGSAGYIRYQNYIDSSSGEAITKNELCKFLNSPNYCDTLLGKNYLDVKEIIITSFKLSTLKSAANNNRNFDRGLREYIDYLPKYNNYSSTYNDYYRLIVEYNNGEYSNIEVHYENE